MDIRAKRSRDKIIDTFLKIRAKKKLEKITVTEICKSAQINKSTFYAHFHDVYDFQIFWKRSWLRKS
ncbi:MAG: TetR/AcrR family transcriptional regulator [Ruminococcus sp.]|nr:TetR/AcrR family transcriptional regulator [Ruminococcus sp.]